MNEIKADKLKNTQIYNSVPFLFMGVLFFAVQILSTKFAPIFNDKGVKATTTPDNPLNFVPFLVFILIFTLIALIAIKKDIEILISSIILLGIASLSYYAFSIFLSVYYSVVFAITLTLLVKIYPSWYLIDIAGIVSGSAAAGIFGASFSPFSSIILLLILAAYDYMAVYKTGHMMSLAEGIMKEKMPVVFVAPKRLNYSLEQGNQGAVVMGLGDAVIPSVLVASLSIFTTQIEVIGAILGSLVGFIFLMYKVSEDEVHAGLPLLNGGAILGYLIFSALF